MYDFMKLKDYEKLRETEDGFVFTPSTTRNYQVLTKLFKTDKTIPVALFGPRDSGKHSLLSYVLKGEDKVVKTIHSSEIVNKGNTCNQLITKILRSAIGVKIKEQQKIVEGEVVSLSSDKIHLKTMDMDSVFDVGVRMAKEIERERVCVGDVIKIYKESCFVTRTGRASGLNASFRSDLLPIVAVPEGECIKNEHIETYITLNELDTINCKENGEEYLYTNKIVSEHIQSEVDKRINKWSKEGKSTLVKGVLIIEDSEKLTNEIIEQITVLARSTISPYVVFIFNQEKRVKFSQGIGIEFSTPSCDYSLSILRKIVGDVDEDLFKYIFEISQLKGLNYTNKILKCIDQPVSVSAVKRLVELYEC